MKHEIKKPNGEVYAEVWVEGGLFIQRMKSHPALRITMDKKIIPQLIEALKLIEQETPMNCCDEYGNCNQGRDCPVRKEQAKCPWCHGLGYDASGQKCPCQPDNTGKMLAWLLGGFVAVMLLLMTLRSCV